MNKNLLALSTVSLVILGLAVILGGKSASSIQERVPNSKGEGTNQSSLHNSRFFEFKEDVKKNLSKGENDQANLRDKTLQIGITSHHLPVAAPLIASLYKGFSISKGPRDTFVILGPDHFEKCKSRIALTEIGYTTPFGEIGINQEMLEKIQKQGFGVDNDCFEGEHSISVQAIFIKNLYPEAKIVPIVFSSGTSEEEINKLAETLFEFKEEISIVVSVDFSHYNSYEEAKLLDRKSEKMIREMNGDSLKLKYVDSPPAVKTALILAEKMGYNGAKVLSRGNSYEFTGKKELTTGYMSIIFQKQ
jgi:MEMO1 family protein